MGLVKGVNCGFVLVAPTVDPGGSAQTTDNIATALKDTSPAGPGRITEIGWFCDSATEEANFEVGIYDHNVGDNNPENIVGVSRTNAKGLTTGWKKVTGLDIPVDGSTIYWIAFQLDDTATPTYRNYKTEAGEKCDEDSGDITLEDPWGVSPVTSAKLVAVYAKWEVRAVDRRATTGKIGRKPLSADVVPGLY